MEKILTVVIPSYNVERFLQETLESFVEERVLKDIEVLVVDDGSKDGTAEIGKAFEQMYPGTFRVISKENGGHGSTINKGIEQCQGKYFKVVDGDDWVNTEDFCILVDKLKTCEADYVVTNYYEVNDQTGEKTKQDFSLLAEAADPATGVLSFEEAAKRVQMPMHALVIRSSILKDNNIRLDEHCFYVDVEYILYPLPYVRTVAYFDLSVYMYRLALATQSVSIQGFQKHMQNHIDVILHLSVFAEKFRKNAEDAEALKIDYICKRIAAMVGDQITIFISFSEKDKRIKEKFIQFDRELRETSQYIYDLSAQESGTFKLLRTVKFKGYEMIVKSARKRNGLEEG